MQLIYWSRRDWTWQCWRQITASVAGSTQSRLDPWIFNEFFFVILSHLIFCLLTLIELWSSGLRFHENFVSLWWKIWEFLVSHTGPKSGMGRYWRSLRWSDPRQGLPSCTGARSGNIQSVRWTRYNLPLQGESSCNYLYLLEMLFSIIYFSNGHFKATNTDSFAQSNLLVISSTLVCFYIWSDFSKISPVWFNLRWLESCFKCYNIIFFLIWFIFRGNHTDSEDH